MHKPSLTLSALALCCVGFATARAQDPVKVAPNNFKVLLENDQVRVLDFHNKGGEKIPMLAPDLFDLRHLWERQDDIHVAGREDQRGREQTWYGNLERGGDARERVDRRNSLFACRTEGADSQEAFWKGLGGGYSSALLILTRP